jgi:hypothetical protein
MKILLLLRLAFAPRLVHRVYDLLLMLLLLAGHCV